MRRAGPTLLGMTPDQLTRNKHLVESFIQELFTKGDLTAVDRYLAVDFVNHDPPFPGAADGAEGMRQAAEVMRAAVPTGAAKPTTTWRRPRRRALPRLRSPHRRALGAPADGKTLTLRGIHIFRIADDKIVERWGRLDDVGLQRQLIGG